MTTRSTNFATILIASFIPWLITLAALGAAASLPRTFFLFFHYALCVLLFGIAFAIYFRGHSWTKPFTVMANAIISILIFEFVYVCFVYEGEFRFLTYLDWIVPLFLIATTIYVVGKIFRENDVGSPRL